MTATFFQVLIGFGTGVSGSPTWTDVTADVVTRVGVPAVTMTTGRRSVRDGITPGRLSFALENHDGKYDPLNASGPYYGQLLVGVPVRVICRYETVNYVPRFGGFVSSPWTSELRRYGDEVPIEAHDVLGLMAAGDREWPDAYEAQIERFDGGNLRRWWRPGATGWMEELTGDTGHYTAAPTEVESTIPGAANTWAITFGTSDAGGVLPPEGDSVLPALWAANPTGKSVMSVVWTADERKDQTDTVVIAQDTADYADGFWDGVRVQFTDTTAHIIVPNASGDMWWLVPRSTIGGVDEVDWSGCGRGTHHLLVAVPDGTVHTTPYPDVWLDGRRLTVGNDATYDLVSKADTPPTVNRGVLSLTAPTWVGTSREISDGYPHSRLGGPLDVATWDNVAATTTELGTFATEVWSALHKVERTMDARLADIADIGGVSDHVGTLDPSGITTLQAYQPGSPIDRLQEVEDTEQGRVWVGGDGDLRFSTRSWAWENAESTTVQLIATDNPAILTANPTVAAEPLESGSTIGLDPTAITNVAAVNSTYGRQQRAVDSGSVAMLGVRNPVTLSGLLHGTDAASRSIAEWLIDSLGVPQRVSRIGFRVEDAQGVLEKFACRVQEGWLIHLAIDTPSGLFQADAHVIGHSHEWSLTGWTVYLDLDSSRAGRTWFRWGYSEWDNSDGEGWMF